MTAGIPGQKFGRRDSLRVMAIFYVLSAIGCAFAWNWPALIFFRFIGGLGIGGSSVLGPHVHRGDRAARMARPPRRLLSGQHRRRHPARLRLECHHRQHALGAHEWRWMFGVSAIPGACSSSSRSSSSRAARAGWSRNPACAKRSRRPPPHRRAAAQRGAGRNRRLRPPGARRHSADPLFSRQYLKPIIIAFTVGMFSQLSGINAILYYLNDIFALAGATQSLRQSAGHRRRRHQPRLHPAGHVGHRQARSQKTVAHRHRRPRSFASPHLLSFSSPITH